MLIFLKEHWSTNIWLYKEIFKKVLKEADNGRTSRKYNWLLTLLAVCQVLFPLPNNQHTNRSDDQVTGWQSWTPLPGVFSCVHPGMTVLPPSIGAKGLQMPNTNHRLPLAPLSCVQSSLCTTSQMLNKDRDTTTATTQLICIVLTNYVNICKLIFTAEGSHIMQCYLKCGSGGIIKPSLAYFLLWILLFGHAGCLQLWENTKL